MICPECAQGKHRNCTRVVPDFESDDPTAMVPCSCPECSVPAAVLPAPVRVRLTPEERKSYRRFAEDDFEDNWYREDAVEAILTARLSGAAGDTPGTETATGDGLVERLPRRFFFDWLTENLPLDALGHIRACDWTEESPDCGCATIQERLRDMVRAALASDAGRQA